MSLIIFVVLAIIVFGRIGLDKAANHEYDRIHGKKILEQNEFKKAVLDEKLEQEIEKIMWTKDVESHIKQIFNSSTLLKEMYQNNLNREDWLFGPNVRKNLLMSEKGKLPLFGGVYLEMWPQNNHVGINYSLDAEKEMGRIIQSNLRNHGISAQMIYNDGKKPVYNAMEKQYEQGHNLPKFEWEPFYNGGDYGERL